MSLFIYLLTKTDMDAQMRFYFSWIHY